MSRVLTRTRTAAALSVVALALAACGGGATQSPAGTPTAPPVGTVLVEASEFKYAPAAITVAAGEVTFSVKNTGQVEHEFEIFKGETVVDEIEGLVPGLTKDLTVTLEAGDYTFVCKLAGHEEQGMTGTLTVTQ